MPGQRGDRVPVVDLFAGPGGLGEGFGVGRLAAFDVAMSVEAERWAHQTLTLRKFFLLAGPRQHRAIKRNFIGTTVNAEELLSLDEPAAQLARNRAVRMKIGPSTHKALLDRFDMQLGRKSDEWVLIGGPPCQAYSLVGRARNKGKTGYVPENDERHFLYENYLRLISDRSPAVFVMENVKGILSSRVNGVRIFDKILEDLREPRRAVAGRRGGPRYEIAYLTDYGDEYPEDDARRYIIRSERHGVPQARHRVILVGVRDDMGAPGKLKTRPEVSVVEAIGGLPRIRSYISRGSANMTYSEWSSAIQQAVKNGLRGLRGDIPRAVRNRLRALSESSLPAIPSTRSGTTQHRFWNHASRGHMLEDLARYFYAAVYAEEVGASPKIGDFPEALWPHHANVRAGGGSVVFSDRFRVQMSGKPATTVTCHISKDGHYYIHYDPLQCRSLTVREAARIQTFPDDYIFCGPRTSQFVQVGNAVPPKLAKQIADAVAKCF